MSVLENHTVPDEIPDLLALTEVLREMVEEALVHGTLMGIDLRYVPDLASEIEDDGGPYWPAMNFCYGYIDPDETMDDDEFARAMEERERPHNERVWAWRERLRSSLAEHDDA